MVRQRDEASSVGLGSAVGSGCGLVRGSGFGSGFGPVRVALVAPGHEPLIR